MGRAVIDARHAAAARHAINGGALRQQAARHREAGGTASRLVALAGSNMISIGVSSSLATSKRLFDCCCSICRELFRARI